MAYQPPQIKNKASFLIEEVVPNQRRSYNPHEQNILQPTGNKQRVPEMLQSALRGRVSDSKSNRSSEEEPKRSKIGQQIRNRVSNAVNYLRDISYCQICEGEMKKPKSKYHQVYLCECEHKQNFCESCLHHYVIYKVKNFEQVMCPYESCPYMLDIQSTFFKSLPLDIQKAYKKIHQFFLVSKDTNLKLCPRQNCEGLLSQITQGVMSCNQCHRQFCDKCLLDAHQGQCNEWEINFFKQNLHYRQCRKCRVIIEKNQGCNHMTCKCGYQFCYVCGEKWTTKHYNDHDENGRVIEGEEEQRCCMNVCACCQCDEDQQCCECCECCQCCECCDEECCQCCRLCDCWNVIQEYCGYTCVRILKLPLKLILILLFIPLMLVVLIFRNVFFSVVLTIVCLIAGIFGFSMVIISESQCPFNVVAVALFPLTMLAGIQMAFSEIYCDVVPDIWNEYLGMCCEGLVAICQI